MSEESEERTLEVAPPEPPVVARLLIEIRSDGTRTVARGALEDVTTGERASLEARGTSPLALAAELTKSLLSLPLLAGHGLAGALERAGGVRRLAGKLLGPKRR